MADQINHGRRPAGAEFEALTVPVVRASTVVFPSAAAFEGRYADFYDGYTYGLYGTPTTKALETEVAALAGAGHALLVPSGQAALTLACLALLRPGEGGLVPDTAYGPLRAFCEGMLRPHGILVSYYDPLVGSGVAGLIDGSTRLVMIESPGSNTMEVQDVRAIAAAARERGALVAADNTWATALLFNPLDHGADLTVEALSKYAGGHADVLMGAITTRDEAVYRRLKDMARLLGLGVSPDDCSLVLRGLQTLPIRLERSGESALEIAMWLAGRPEVDRVLHPALPTCPGHETWARDFKGSSGVFSVVLRGDLRGRLHHLVDGLERFRIGASWGGTQSLAAVQDPTSGRTATCWTDGPVLRLAIGLEPPDELVADLAQAFSRIAGPTPSFRSTARETTP